MKLNRFTQAVGLGGWALSALLLAGCRSVSYDDPNPQKPYVFPSQRKAAGADLASAGAPPAVAPAPVSDAGTPPPIPTPTSAAIPSAPDAPVQDASTIVLQKGDLVTITFSDVPIVMPDHKERIRDDGKMTLMYNVTVQAAGKTPGELQEAIRAAYVPKYFKYLTATVKIEDRFYFVGGEVRIPNRQLYLGNMTVLRAIDTAGGFTDFAQRKKIELRRGDRTFKVDYFKAIKNPKLDLEVVPNDQIIVHKRFL